MRWCKRAMDSLTRLIDDAGAPAADVGESQQEAPVPPRGRSDKAQRP